MAAGSSGGAGKVRSKDNNPMTDPATNKVLALRKRAEEEEGRTPIGIAGPQAQRTRRLDLRALAAASPARCICCYCCGRMLWVGTDEISELEWLMMPVEDDSRNS